MESLHCTQTHDRLHELVNPIRPRLIVAELTSRTHLGQSSLAEDGRKAGRIYSIDKVAGFLKVARDPYPHCKSRQRGCCWLGDNHTPSRDSNHLSGACIGVFEVMKPVMNKYYVKARIPKRQRSCIPANQLVELSESPTSLLGAPNRFEGQIKTQGGQIALRQ